MKTIGLIGGMSWESSAVYYRILNTEVKQRLGGLHSAKCLLYSVDFQEIEHCQAKGDWDQAADILGQAAASLVKAGADFILICTNTMHKVVDDIQQHIQIPILHIADATAAEIQQHRIRTVGLLGTKYTMEQDFYKSRIAAQHIEVRIPNEADRALVNAIIYDELCMGIISEQSKRQFQHIIARLVADGAEGIILGCTEIGLLVKPEDASIPLFDTTSIHAIEAVRIALEE